MNTNQEQVVEIAGKHLGQTVGNYSVEYDPSLLVQVPRQLNRTDLGITDKKLPFKGFDVWNAYEFSTLNKDGWPVNGLLKIVYAAHTEFHVESKSLKLYLNSFNMTRWDDVSDALKAIKEDIGNIVGSYVDVGLHPDFYNQRQFKYHGYIDLDGLMGDDYRTVDTPFEGLKIGLITKHPALNKVYTNLLRSNCRVTNQPDWGDVYIHMKGTKEPDWNSVGRYIVEQRQINHFHEEVCEMIFVNMLEAYDPDELAVTCLYTRRGGIDINPIRATDVKLIPTAFIDPMTINLKTIRQ